MSNLLTSNCDNTCLCTFSCLKALTLVQEIRLEVRFYVDVSLSPVLHVFTSLVKGTFHIIKHRHDPSCLESKSVDTN